MAFVIQKNVPVPTATRVRQKGDFAQGLEAMDVEDSFFAPGRNPKGVYAAMSPKKYPGKKFRAAVTTEVPADAAEGSPAVAGVRVWRTA